MRFAGTRAEGGQDHKPAVGLPRHCCFRLGKLCIQPDSSRLLCKRFPGEAMAHDDLYKNFGVCGGAWRTRHIKNHTLWTKAIDQRRRPQSPRITMTR